MIYHTTLGAGLLGGYLTAVMYGMLCLQCWSFLQRYKRDEKLLRVSVLSLWLLGTLHAALVGHVLYSYLVLNFSNPEVLLAVPWSTASSAIVTGVTTLIVQSWYCYRVWIMSDRNRLVTYPLVLTVNIAVGFGMASNIKLFLIPNFSFFVDQHWLFFVSLGLFAAADVYIALVLCFLLYRQREGLTRRTYSMVNTIMIYTVNTGLITSVFAVADVTTCAAMPNNFIFVAIYFLLNGLYSNSLLASLNARDYLSRCHESGMTPAPMTSIKFAQSVQVMESGIAHTESSEDGPGESEKL